MSRARYGWRGPWGRVVLAAVLLAVAWVVRDYRGWLALGPGGLPHTARGWLTMAALRVRTWRVDPFDTAELAVTVHLADALPKRVGPRPAVARYPIPHRQLEVTSRRVV